PVVVIWNLVPETGSYVLTWRICVTHDPILTGAASVQATLLASGHKRQASRLSEGLRKSVLFALDLLRLRSPQRGLKIAHVVGTTVARDDVIDLYLAKPRRWRNSACFSVPALGVPVACPIGR